MQRLIALVCMAALLTVLSSACARQEKQIDYYNGYLGLTVHAPKGWRVTEKSGANLTDTPEGITGDEQLERTDLGDGGYSLDLIGFANRRLNSTSTHMEIRLYAEEYPEWTTKEYLDAYEEYLGLEEEDSTYNVLEREWAILNGHEFTRFLVEVTLKDGGDTFMEEYYITPIRGIHLIAYINYWTENVKSQQEVAELLSSSFTLGAPAQQAGTSI